MTLTHGVKYALLSMFFAGLNDVIFKKYALKDRSRGIYVFGVGLTWTILQILYSHLSNIPYRFDHSTIYYGILAGLILVAANIALIESLTRINVSLGSTTYRLNTIGVVILSWAFLHESIGWIKLTGILFGIVAVLLLYQGQRQNSPAPKTNLFLWLAISASAFRATYGVITKLALSVMADRNGIIILAAIFWIIGGAFYARYIEKKMVITRTMAIYALVSGLLVFCIVNFLVLGLESGQASIVVPIANMSFIIALLISVLTGTEKIDVKKIAATGFAAASIVLLSNA